MSGRSLVQAEADRGRAATGGHQPGVCRGRSPSAHGHPSTLHLWWARRPLAACRAVLFAQLVDDPSAHPEEFPTEEEQKAERDRLHGIISRLVSVGEHPRREAAAAKRTRRS